MRIGICKKMLAITFKERSVFRFNYILSTLFSFFYIVLKVFIWRGLYGNHGDVIKGMVLNDMIAYTVFSGFTEGLTQSSVMTELNNIVLDGSITSYLVLPIGLKKIMFISSLMNNLFWTVYGVIPSLVIAISFFQFHFELKIINLFMYLVAVIAGIIISFLYNFLFGLSVIWLRNSFFLTNINSVLMNLFSGALVPIWFFPESLKKISIFLPFRYIVFEPLSILLNKKNIYEILNILFLQILWIGILMCVVRVVWDRGRRKIMIQGG